MVAWNDYKKTSRERGALALELFVVESTPAKTADIMKASLPDHLTYQRELEQRGVLVLAGPLSDESGENMLGAGLIIYRAASLEEAITVVKNDPMHLSGARSFTIRKWLVNEGSLVINVGLSTGKVTLS
ncbi:MAG: hypothetical protein JKY83_00270 [Rhizobiaceae bacterium]|nr:hypothetical protein [Rhizobiaceae bacterium]